MKRLAFIILMALCVSVFGAEVYRLATDATVGNDFDTDGMWSAFPTGAVLYLPMSQSTNGYGVNYSPDFSGSGNDPVVTTASHSNSVAGGCYYFLDPDFLQAVDANSLDLGTADFTLGAWLNITNGTQHNTIMAKQNPENPTEWSFQLQQDNMHLAFRAAGQQAVEGVVTTPDNVWTHAMVTRTGGTMQLYSDGVPNGNSGTFTSNFNNSAALHIGYRNSGYHGSIKGFLDEPLILTRALTAQEVRDTFALGTATHEPIPAFNNTVLYSPFNVSNALETVDQSYYAMKNWPGNVGAVSNAVWDSASTGYTFDGADDYIKIANSSTFDFPAGFTVSAWANPTTADAVGRLLYHYDAVSTDGFYLSQSATGSGEWLFTVFVAGANANALSDAAPTGGDQHICGVRESDGTLKLYVDGILQTDTGTIAGAIDSSDPVYIGVANNLGADYTGTLDDPAIWNTALTSNQVFTLSQQAH